MQPRRPRRGGIDLWAPASAPLPGQKLELGKRLAGNEKLKRLAPDGRADEIRRDRRSSERRSSNAPVRKSWRSSAATRYNDCWDIQKQEEIVSEKLEEYENADTIPEENLSEEGKKALEKAKERLGGEVQGAEALLRHKTAQLKEDLRGSRSADHQPLAGGGDQSCTRARRCNRGGRGVGINSRHRPALPSRPKA